MGIAFVMVNTSIQVLDISSELIKTDDVITNIVRYNTTLTELHAYNALCSEKFFDAVAKSNRLVNLTCSVANTDLYEYGVHKISECCSNMVSFYISQPESEIDDS
jgi:hypothetical protein